jgi:hypothetical protein
MKENLCSNIKLKEKFPFFVAKPNYPPDTLLFHQGSTPQAKLVYPKPNLPPVETRWEIRRFMMRNPRTGK